MAGRRSPATSSSLAPSSQPCQDHAPAESGRISSFTSSHRHDGEQPTPHVHVHAHLLPTGERGTAARTWPVVKTHQFLAPKGAPFLAFHSCVQWWQKHDLRSPDQQQDAAPALGRGMIKSKRWDISCPFSPRPMVVGIGRASCSRVSSCGPPHSPHTSRRGLTLAAKVICVLHIEVAVFTRRAELAADVWFAETLPVALREK